MSHRPSVVDQFTRLKSKSAFTVRSCEPAKKNIQILIRAGPTGGKSSALDEFFKKQPGFTHPRKLQKLSRTRDKTNTALSRSARQKNEFQRLTTGSRRIAGETAKIREQMQTCPMVSEGSKISLPGRLSCFACGSVSTREPSLRSPIHVLRRRHVRDQGMDATKNYLPKVPS